MPVALALIRIGKESEQATTYAKGRAEVASNIAVVHLSSYMPTNRGGTRAMVRIGMVVGSTRPGRKAPTIAEWAHEILKRRKDAEFEIVDIEDYKLPLLDEPAPPVLRRYAKPHTQAWSAKIDSLDGFVFITPEYNHGTSAALKNAIDFLFHEWNNKAAGFIGYGGSGGIRAVENLRLVMGEIKVADVRAEVNLSLRTDFENYTAFKPHEKHTKSLHALADDLIPWAEAFKTLRNGMGG
jgi:NAD(P)H-dependent FMN reductase